MKQTDVIIVGAGPAGSACAWKLQQYGISTLMLDKKIFPRTKLCAGWVTPQVFHMLDTEHKKYPYDLTHFSSFQVTIKNFRFQLPVNQFAIRRYDFDHWLVKRSKTEVHLHQVREIRQNEGLYIIDELYAAPILIGAGGTNCPVRKFLSPWNDSQEESLIVALEEEFQYTYSDNRCHLWFMQQGLPGYSWYVPKANGVLNVGIGGKMAKLKEKGTSIWDHWNEFIEQLTKSGLVNGHAFHPKGHSYYLTHKNHEIRSNGIFLIGDSAGLATLDMGEGIGPAIQSGIKAAKAIINKKEYIIHLIPRYSFPSILKLRN